MYRAALAIVIAAIVWPATIAAAWIIAWREDRRLARAADARDEWRELKNRRVLSGQVWR